MQSDFLELGIFVTDKVTVHTTGSDFWEPRWSRHSAARTQGLHVTSQLHCRHAKAPQRLFSSNDMAKQPAEGKRIILHPALGTLPAKRSRPIHFSNPNTQHSQQDLTLLPGRRKGKTQAQWLWFGKLQAAVSLGLAKGRSCTPVLLTALPLQTLIPAETDTTWLTLHSRFPLASYSTQILIFTDKARPA